MIERFIDTIDSVSTDKLTVCALGLIATLIVVLGYLSAQASGAEQAEWDVFAAANNCQVVEQRAARSSTGYGYGLTAEGSYGYGVVTTHTPSEVAWRCDDGVTYWRRAR